MQLVTNTQTTIIYCENIRKRDEFCTEAVRIPVAPKIPVAITVCWFVCLFFFF